jgi:hypothetical protein
MMKTTAAIVTLCATFALTGCPVQSGSDPIVAEWKGETAVGSYYNSLEVDDDMSGEATLYYYDSEGYLYYADFRVDVEVTGGGEYTLGMECKGDCSWADFDMDCELNSDADGLDCEGDGIWAAYEFEWELD